MSSDPIVASEPSFLSSLVELRESFLAKFTFLNVLDWSLINVVCLASSVIFLFLISSIGLDDPEGRTVSKEIYLLYDFSMTAVWVLEILDIRLLRQQQRSWSLYVEFFLAVYFLLDSAASVLVWDLKSEQTTYILVDMGINAASYGYILWAERQSRRAADYEALGSAERNET